MSELLTVNGSATFPHDGLHRGDEVVLVVTGRIRASEERDTASKGTDYVLKVSMSEVTVATNDEVVADALDRISEAKRLRTDKVSKDQEQIAGVGGGEYRQMKVAKLRELCKERGLSQAGGKADLAQRLADNE